MPTQNKPVYRGVVSVSLFLLAFLLFAAPADALTGYFESFGDANDQGSVPVAEPTAWYTSPGTTGHMGAGSGGWGTVNCGNFNGATCAGTESASINLAAGVQPGTGVDWSFNFTYSIQRKCAAAGNPSGQSCTGYTGPGIAAYVITGSQHSIDGAFLGSPSQDQISDNTVCTINPQTVAASTFSRSGFVNAYYTAATTTISFSTSTGSCSTVNSAFAGPTSFRFDFFAGAAQTISGGNLDRVFVSNMAYWYSGATGTYTAPFTPATPAGVTATVIAKCASNGSGSFTSTVAIRWPLSSNDPDQTTGTFNYYVYVNGVNTGADTITGQDGNAHRYATFTVLGNNPSCNSVDVIWIVATNAGLSAAPTCSVTVHDTVSGETATCGTGSGGIGSNPAASTGNPLGQMVQTLNNAWGFDWSWIIGAIIMALCVAAVWMMGDFVVALVIFLVAVANAKLGLWPEWSIFAIVFISIAMAGNRLFGKKGENADGDSA